MLRRLVYELHGSNHGAALPHLEAGIIAAIGQELGLPGTTAAQNDAHKQGCSDPAQHSRKFRQMFQANRTAVVDWLVVNAACAGR